ncbi:hypothetical protein Tco_1472988 [Tanacetum coccineum]
MSQDILLNVINSMSLNNDSVNMEMQKCESCEKCLNLDVEFSKSKQAYNDLLKNYTQLEKHSQLQDKNTTICKLKDTIKSLRENTKEENVNHDKCELDPINEELENSVAKLLSENVRICNEINHVKQDLNAQIQDKVFVITSLKNDLRKSKGKEIVDNALQIPSATTIALGMFKLDLEPLAPRLVNYLRYTQEHVNILREIVKQAKAKHPLDIELDFSYKHAIRIQELLIYVRDTFPNMVKPSAKKVESSKTSDSNTPVLSSTGVKCSTSNYGSKSPDNKKNDRISQTPSRNMKNKVEAQSRKVNKTSRVVKPICNVDVKHSLSNTNSEILCATCNKSMFDSVHDKCLLDFVDKSAKKHKK